ncbi:MAG: c-type cytochrome [Candidatus Loosdrechtia sp.]|uniref:c-type cytochrome n=1 Tax=Candidatus Loosdrechtia sp. TaxID=3101272 RepID=UPI003A6E333D|nr:MAG: c-type cytochrome [Candidatus Jettenia sp. AMX2]
MPGRKIFTAALYLAVFSAVVCLLKVSVLQAETNARELYMMHCKTCHGPDGKPTDLGQGLEARDFTDPQWQAKATDEQIIKQIIDGTPDKMFSFKDKLSEEEIKALVPIVRSFGKK